VLVWLRYCRQWFLLVLVWERLPGLPDRGNREKGTHRHHPIFLFILAGLRSQQKAGCFSPWWHSTHLGWLKTGLLLQTVLVRLWGWEYHVVTFSFRYSQVLSEGGGTEEYSGCYQKHENVRRMFLITNWLISNAVFLNCYLQERLRSPTLIKQGGSSETFLGCKRSSLCSYIQNDHSSKSVNILKNKLRWWRGLEWRFIVFLCVYMFITSPYDILFKFESSLGKNNQSVMDDATTKKIFPSF
jgi:hypothetical protein